MKPSPRTSTGETRRRLLEAAELLFIEHGFDGMSLRLITTKANANLAAVNYHFGSKEALLQEVLSRRLERLNTERLALLDDCEREWQGAPDCLALLGVLFIPALRLNRDPAGGPAFMRLLGRVYSDASPFVRDYLQEHYRPIFVRFFDAFARALPQLPRNELGLRLHYALKALSGMLASDHLENLIATLSMGENLSETEVLSRLISLLAATITAPFGGAAEVRMLERITQLADGAVLEERARPATGIPAAVDSDVADGSGWFGGLRNQPA